MPKQSIAPEDRSPTLRHYYANQEQEKARLRDYSKESRRLESEAEAEKRREYMRVYHRTHPHPVRSREYKNQQNAKRREQYSAADPTLRVYRKAYAKEYRQKHPQHKRTQDLRQYGLTIIQFEALLAKQHGACAICGHQDLSNKKMFPTVDHCHATGKVRGLLCMQCNNGLGKFKDNPALLMKAAEYLSNLSCGATSTLSSEPSTKP
jgi:Recombination endonuclease VII